MTNYLRRLVYLLRARRDGSRASRGAELHRELTRERLEREGVPAIDAAGLTDPFSCRRG